MNKIVERVEAVEVQRLMFDINITFEVNENPYTITIPDILDRNRLENYSSINTDLIIDLEADGDKIIAFNRDNGFEIRLYPDHNYSIDLSPLRTTKLITDDRHYVALNKLREQFKDAPDPDITLYWFLRDSLKEGFNQLGKLVEKRLVESKFKSAS